MNILRKTAVFICIALIATFFTACGGEKEYTVELKTEGGMPLEDIGIKVYTDKKLDDLVWAAETDEEGKTSFTAEGSNKYTVILEDLPAGYETAGELTLRDEHTVITAKAVLQKSNELSDITYKAGDVIRDFTITSVSGERLSISALLKEKKAVVLNFWYLNCEPCKMEFPYLEKAYKEYAEDIEVIAVNPLDGGESSISDFAKAEGLTFPMAKGETEWEKCMQLTAYPTTVVIDRYGTIAMIHKGAVTEDGVFEKIFEYFADEAYVQSIIKNINDIK